MERGASISDHIDQIKDLILNDEDWVYSRRYGYSAEKLAKKFPDGVPDKILQEVLLHSPEELDVIFQEIVLELRELMKVIK